MKGVGNYGGAESFKQQTTNNASRLGVGGEGGELLLPLMCLGRSIPHHTKTLSRASSTLHRRIDSACVFAGFNGMQGGTLH
jgi:hypothetical protein